MRCFKWERYVDGAAKTYGELAARTEAAPCYRPESGATSFDACASASISAK
jgi:hypothetical protein